MKKSRLILTATLAVLAQEAVAQKPDQVSSNLPPSAISEIHNYFAEDANGPLFLVPSDLTQFAWQNVSRFYPTALVARAGKVSELPVALDDRIGSISAVLHDGRSITLQDVIAEEPVDAVLVVHEGQIVFERYVTMRPTDRHIWFSSGKVIGATLLAMFEEESLADLSLPVSDYIEELAGTVWDNVPLRNAVNMATGLNGTEHDEPSHDSRTNPEQIWFQWVASLGMFPRDASNTDTPWDVLGRMSQRRDPNSAFEYNSINTFIVDTAVERISGRTLNDVFSSRIWSRIGAEGDGSFGVSISGEPLTFGLYSSTLRDFARFGMIFTPSWKVVSDQQIISDAILDRIRTSGRPESFSQAYLGGVLETQFPGVEGMTNAYQWDAILPDGDMYKAGVGGQSLYVSPSRDTVVVFFRTGDNTDIAPTISRAIALALE